MLEQADIQSLSRPSFLGLLKVMAAFQQQSATEFVNELCASEGLEPVKNPYRSALPEGLRESAHRHYEGLAPPLRAALEHIHSTLAKGAPKKTGSENGADLSRQMQAVLRNPGSPVSRAWLAEKTYASLEHWFDLKSFDLGSLDRIAGWHDGRKLRYVVLRLERPGLFRCSIMQLWRHPGAGLLPLFQTTRKTKYGHDKTVKGIALATEQELYTLGQLTEGHGLRFSRLTRISIADKIDLPDETQYQRDGEDLYGLRLGREARTQRPYAHCIFARAIPQDDPLLSAGSAGARVWERIRGKPGALTAADLLPLLPEIDRIEGLLDQAGEHGGLTPDWLDI